MTPSTMATRNDPASIEARLRAARPVAPLPRGGYTQRVWARIRAQSSSPITPLVLALPWLLALSAAAALSLWWILGGPWVTLSATLRALAPYAGTLAWVWTRAPWLGTLGALALLAAGLQAIGVSWWARRRCRLRGCLAVSRAG